MKIAHVDAPLARRGGPSGYLWQLAAAHATHGAGSRHRLTFPAPEIPAPMAPASRFASATTALRRAARSMLGPPTFYRPSREEFRRSGGVIDAMVTTAVQTARRETQARVAEAVAGDADVLFAHNVAVADRLLEERRNDQEVWLLQHSPIPTALYLAWTWGMPEWDWAEIVGLPDTSRWIGWEADVYARVHRLIVPCEEAMTELVRVDARFARFTTFDTLLTGAAGPVRRFADESRDELRRRFGLPVKTPVGLFLGSAQPYRGFDRLLDGLRLVPGSIRGVVAVAGPPKSRVPRHRRLRALGAVAEVSDLLAAVDFVINVNQFSLFDLSTIEAAEAGCPMLMHATGGNRRFDRLGIGSVMLPDLQPSTIAAGLGRMFTMPAIDRRALGYASRVCYERSLTPAHLWANHAALYDHADADRQVLTVAR